MILDRLKILVSVVDVAAVVVAVVVVATVMPHRRHQHQFR
jgi:hypothetical protein